MFNKTQKELENLLQQLKEGNLSNDKLQNIIHILAEEKYEKAKPEIKKYLNHSDLFVRNMALSALTLHWHEIGLKKHCIDLLNRPLPENELDLDDLEFEQGTAIYGLGAMLWEHKDDEILRFFLAILNDEKSPMDKKYAPYDGILNYLEKPFFKGREFPMTDEGIKKYIDWKLIKKLSEQLNGKKKPITSPTEKRGRRK